MDSFLDNTPFNFLGIPEISQDAARVLILPVPFEETTSYGHGTKNGPQAILDASRQIELYDPEFKDELSELVSIATLAAVEGDLEEVHEAAKQHVDKFLISLGGEHSITPALIAPYLEKYPKLSVLQIDAHTDMRDEFEGTKYSHACAMRRVAEQGIGTILIYYKVQGYVDDGIGTWDFDFETIKMNFDVNSE